MKTTSIRLALLLAVPAVLTSMSAAALEPPARPQPVGQRKSVGLRLNPTVRLGHVAGPIAVPNGSYLASCQNVAISGDVLSASCQLNDGRRRDTSISVSGCEGVDIFNRNGSLLCVTPVRARWAGPVLPPGNYINSCNARVFGVILYAGCLTGEGDVSILGIEVQAEGQRNNHLDLSRCPDGSEIADLHGDLTCIAR